MHLYNNMAVNRILSRTFLSDVDKIQLDLRMIYTFLRINQKVSFYSVRKSGSSLTPDIVRFS